MRMARKKLKDNVGNIQKMEIFRKIQYQGPNNVFEHVAWVQGMWMELIRDGVGCIV